MPHTGDAIIIYLVAQSSFLQTVDTTYCLIHLKFFHFARKTINALLIFLRDAIDFLYGGINLYGSRCHLIHTAGDRVG